MSTFAFPPVQPYPIMAQPSIIYGPQPGQPVILPVGSQQAIYTVPANRVSQSQQVPSPKKGALWGALAGLVMTFFMFAKGSSGGGDEGKWALMSFFMAPVLAGFGAGLGALIQIARPRKGE